MDQPGKVANPARGQLNRENEYFPVLVGKARNRLFWGILKKGSGSAFLCLVWVNASFKQDQNGYSTIEQLTVVITPFKGFRSYFHHRDSAVLEQN